MTVWARLRGIDQERLEFMHQRENRPYAAIVRAALALYYHVNYVDTETAA